MAAEGKHSSIIHKKQFWNNWVLGNRLIRKYMFISYSAGLIGVFHLCPTSCVSSCIADASVQLKAGVLNLWSVTRLTPCADPPLHTMYRADLSASSAHGTRHTLHAVPRWTQSQCTGLVSRATHGAHFPCSMQSVWLVQSQAPQAAHTSPRSCCVPRART